MSDVWMTIGVDVTQAKKLWKALVTEYVAFGKAEAEAMTMASTEIAVRAVPMTMAPTVALASQIPAKKMHGFIAK